MTHRGTRSQTAKIRRIIRTFVRHQEYRCSIWVETVCRTSRIDVLTHLEANFPEQYEGFDPSQIPDYVEKGIVLTDSRGRGALQK